MQFFKKEVSGEVDFFHVDKHESFLQIVLWFFMGMVKYSQRYQNSKFAISLQYLKKAVWDKVEKVDAIIIDGHD